MQTQMQELYITRQQNYMPQQAYMPYTRQSVGTAYNPFKQEIIDLYVRNPLLYQTKIVYKLDPNDRDDDKDEDKDNDDNIVTKTIKDTAWWVTEAIIRILTGE